MTATRTDTPTGRPPDDGLDVLAARLDQTMVELAALGPAARTTIRSALDALDRLHRDGLTSIVRRLRADDRGRELLYELVDDPAVRMVLAMHEIIRPDPATLAHRALESIRPTLSSHGGDAELVAVDDGVARIRLLGACNGCSMASVTLRDTVEAALMAGVPGLRSVEVVPADPSPALIPVDSLTVRTSGPGADSGQALAAAGWVASLTVADLPVGELRAVSVRGPDGDRVDAILVNATGAPTAYVNACAHLGLRLDNAVIDAAAGTLTCPWHGFCYDATDGDCLTVPGATLRRLPLRVAGDRLWIRPVADE